MLFNAGLLTVEVLEKQLPLFIFESALTGKWEMLGYWVRERPTEIFPGYLGHAEAWKDFNHLWQLTFEAGTAHWKSRLLDAEFSEDMPTTGSAAPPRPVPASKRGRRALVDRFITRVLESTGRRITRKDIWAAAGYSNATDFQRFQRNDKRTSRAALANFSRILNMEPEEFLRILNRKRPGK